MGNCSAKTKNIQETVHEPVENNAEKVELLNFFDLPNELLILVLNELRSVDIMRCRKISTQFYDLIEKNWYRVPRPRMKIEVVLELQPQKVQHFIKRLSKRVAWRSRVCTMFRQYSDSQYNQLRVTHYERGILKIREEINSEDKPLTRGILLEHCKHVLQQRGFSGKLRTIKNRYTKKMEDELLVQIPSWTTALKEWMGLLTSTRYRFTIHAYISHDSIMPGADAATCRYFHEIIEEFVRNERGTIEMYYQTHLHPEWLPQLVYDSLRSIKDQQLQFIYNKNYCGDGIGGSWTIRFHETDVTVWRHVHYRTSMKTLRTPKQAHELKITIPYPPFDIHSLVEMSVSHIIEIRVDRDIEHMIPSFLQTILEQWYSGKRTIKKLIVDLDRYYYSRKDFRLNFREILKVFSPIELEPKDGWIERFWMNSKIQGPNGIRIQLHCGQDTIRCSKANYHALNFAYIIEECPGSSR